jgi:pilus assembly protein CpaB
VAALGTALIWLYVQGADSRAEASTAQVQVLVAGSPVRAGEAAAGVKPQQRLVPQSLVDGLGGNLVTNPSDIKGFVRTDIVPGLPLLKTQFSADAPVASSALQGQKPEQVAMQVNLPDPQRLAGLLQPGSHIRVYAGIVDPDDSKKKSVGVLFNDVTVLLSGPAPTAPAPANGQGNAVPQASVTLALTNQQAKSLVFALNSAGGDGGGLWFGLLGSKVPKDEGGTVTGINPGAN